MGFLYSHHLFGICRACNSYYFLRALNYEDVESTKLAQSTAGSTKACKKVLATAPWHEAIDLPYIGDLCKVSVPLDLGESDPLG